MDSRIDTNRIQDILELQRLKSLYFYNLDLKNWDEWKSLFTSDTRLLVDLEDPKKGTDITEGLNNVIEYVKDKLSVIRSVHHGHTPLFQFESDTEARGIWAMADIIYFDDNTVLYGYGHYRETYRKEQGVWKFSSVHLTRLATDHVYKT